MFPEPFARSMLRRTKHRSLSVRRYDLVTVDPEFIRDKVVRSYLHRDGVYKPAVYTHGGIRVWPDDSAYDPIPPRALLPQYTETFTMFCLICHEWHPRDRSVIHRRSAILNIRNS